MKMDYNDPTSLEDVLRQNTDNTKKVMQQQKKH